jgi:hypothetical protein
LEEDAGSKINGNAEGPVVVPVAPPAIFEPQNEAESAIGPPYLTERALIRELTLPPIPNLDIPQSPPGSPDPGTNRKFKHFLDLKSQGTHFNDKLAASSSLKNPSLLNKLMEYAEITDVDQHATSLPTSIWNPAGFPPWAFKEELLKSSQEVSKKEEERRAKGQRDAIDFVPGTASGDSSRGGTPGGGKGLRISAAERVMAGLSRESTKSPIGSDRGISGDKRRLRRDRGISPKQRKRSRSR